MMKKYPKKSRQSIKEVPKKPEDKKGKNIPVKKGNLDQEDKSTSQPQECKSSQVKNINRSVLTLHLSHSIKLISLNWCALLKEDK